MCMLRVSEVNTECRVRHLIHVLHKNNKNSWKVAGKKELYCSEIEKKSHVLPDQPHYTDLREPIQNKMSAIQNVLEHRLY